MKIAVTYENGNVFQGTGRPKQIKLYVVENNRIVDSGLYAVEGVGRASFALVLANSQVNILLCNGLDGSAKSMIERDGIKVVTGVSGNSDAVIDQYLKNNPV